MANYFKLQDALVKFLIQKSFKGQQIFCEVAIYFQINYVINLK